MPITLQQLKNEMQYHTLAANSILSDMKYCFNAEKRLLYNLDFNILFPYIWPTQPPTVPTFKPYGRRIFQALTRIKKLRPGFRLVFSGASYLELLDSIVHQIEHWRGRRYGADYSLRKCKKAVESIGSGLEADDWKDQLIKAGVARDDLQLLLESDFDQRIRGPIQNVKELIGTDSVLQGLGDFVEYSDDFKNVFKNTIEPIREEMLSKRPGRSRDERSKENREFHYEIDCANISDVMALSLTTDGTKVCFVSDSRLIVEYCGEIHGRLSLVPYYWISALVLRDSGYVGYPQSFFEMMAAESKNILMALKDVKETNNIPTFLAKRAQDYLDTYVGPLKYSEKLATDPVALEEREAFLEVLRNPGKFGKRYDDAADTLAVNASDLLNDQTVEEIEMALDLSTLRRSPVLKRIEKTLRISL